MIGITGAKGVLGRIICQKLKSQNVDFSIFNDEKSKMRYQTSYNSTNSHLGILARLKFYNDRHK